MVTAAVFLSKFSVLYFFVKLRAYFDTIQRLCAFRGLCLLVFKEIFMYLPIFVQRVDGAINLSRCTGCRGLQRTFQSCMAKKSGQDKRAFWVTVPPFIIHYPCHVIWIPKNRPKKKSVRVIALPAPPPPRPWIVIYSLNNWGELKIYVYFSVRKNKKFNVDIA